MTIQQVLAENLKALMDAQRPPMSGRQVAARAEIDQKTVSRMLNCANSPTLGALAAVAEVFGLLPWQLLVPGLNSGTNEAEKQEVALTRRTRPS